MKPNSKTAAPSSSSDTATVLKKPAGVRESGSTRKDGTLSQDGRFKWSAGWGRWVPTGKEPLLAIVDDPSPNQILGAAALVPIRHGSFCLCAACSVAGQVYADYLKAKGMWP